MIVSLVLAWSLMAVACGWLFSARLVYRNLVRGDKRRSVTYMEPKDGSRRYISDCPDFRKTWHRASVRCPRCGDPVTDWEKTRQARVKLAILGGPFVLTGMAVTGLILRGQPVQSEELSEQVARAEAVLAAVNRKLAADAEN